MNPDPAQPPPGDNGKGKAEEPAKEPAKEENRTPTPESSEDYSTHSSDDYGRGHPYVGNVMMFPKGASVSVLHGSELNITQCQQEKEKLSSEERRGKHPAVIVGTKKSTEGDKNPILRAAWMSSDPARVGTNPAPSTDYVTGPKPDSKIDTTTVKNVRASHASLHKSGAEPWNVHGFEPLRQGIGKSIRAGHRNSIAVQPHDGGQTDEAHQTPGAGPSGSHGHEDESQEGQPGHEGESQEGQVGQLTGPHPGQLTRQNTIGGPPPTSGQNPGPNTGTGNRGRPLTRGGRGGRRGASNPPSRGGALAGGNSQNPGNSRGASNSRNRGASNSRNRGASNSRRRGRGGGGGGNNPNTVV
jgi:hypothetical protein